MASIKSLCVNLQAELCFRVSAHEASSSVSPLLWSSRLWLQHRRTGQGSEDTGPWRSPTLTQPDPGKIIGRSDLPSSRSPGLHIRHCCLLVRNFPLVPGTWDAELQRLPEDAHQGIRRHGYSLWLKLDNFIQIKLIISIKFLNTMHTYIKKKI